MLWRERLHRAGTIQQPRRIPTRLEVWVGEPSQHRADRDGATRSRAVPDRSRRELPPPSARTGSANEGVGEVAQLFATAKAACRCQENGNAGTGEIVRVPLAPVGRMIQHIQCAFSEGGLCLQLVRSLARSVASSRCRQCASSGSFIRTGCTECPWPRPPWRLSAPW